MNFKFKHIRNGFLLQIVFFILFLLICTGICLFYLSLKKATDATENQFSMLGREIQNTHVLAVKEMIDGNYSDENDGNVTLSNLEKIEDSLNSILDLSYLRSLLETSFIDDSLFSALSDCQQSVRYLALAEEELILHTQKNSGALSSISTRLLKSITPAIDSELYAYAIGLKDLESEFLSSADEMTYNDLMTLVDNLSYHPAIQESAMSGYTTSVDLLEEYRNKARLVHSVLNRIGNKGDTGGYIHDIRNDLTNLENRYERFDDLVLQKLRQRRKAMFIALLFVILLFFAAYILLFVYLMKGIKTPLSQLVKFSFSLSKGKLSLSELDENVPYEFSSVNKSLNKTFRAAKEKKSFVDNLLKQQFDSDLSLQGRSDTFGKTLLALKENMRKAREEQLKHAEENRLRRYLNEGIAQFANILRSNSSDLDKLSDVFIRELVKYMEAIQGGLFLVNEKNEEELDLVAAFAYNRKKYIEKTIVRGVGLVGTCALEKKSINLSEIPEDYIEITSGLGDALPTNLLLLPVMHENELIGVIEIASLGQFETHQIEAGENIASSLASTIINAKINTKTSQLLSKSQQQAAEMAEQEEEMRQNMEELKATQEESARREEELEGFLNAINHSFYVIEYDTGGIIQSANQKLMDFLNLGSDHIIGKTHNELFGKGAKADDLLFASVSEGNTVELTENILLNNKPVEISNMFSPIKSKEGATTRILNIMTVNFK
jgi:PAS domain-containing protein